MRHGRHVQHEPLRISTFKCNLFSSSPIIADVSALPVEETLPNVSDVVPASVETTEEIDLVTGKKKIVLKGKKPKPTEEETLPEVSEVVPESVETTEEIDLITGKKKTIQKKKHLKSKEIQIYESNLPYPLLTFPYKNPPPH